MSYSARPIPDINQSFEHVNSQVESMTWLPFPPELNACTLPTLYIDSIVDVWNSLAYYVSWAIFVIEGMGRYTLESWSPRELCIIPWKDTPCSLFALPLFTFLTTSSVRPISHKAGSVVQSLLFAIFRTACRLLFVSPGLVKVPPLPYDDQYGHSILEKHNDTKGIVMHDFQKGHNSL